jgi:hypothetical protein
METTRDSINPIAIIADDRYLLFRQAATGLLDIGSDFYSVKSWVDWDSSGRRIVCDPAPGGNRNVSSGTVFPFDPDDQNAPLASSGFELNAVGALAIDRVKPSNPLVDLAVTIGELREGLPSLMLRWYKTKDARRSGDDYLNVEFGWKPLLRDLFAALDAHEEYEKLLARQRERGKELIRRRYDFDTFTSTTVSQVGTGFPTVPVLPGDNYASYGVVTRERTITRKRWFSGAFVHYVPDPMDPRVSAQAARLRRARDQYGFRLTPDVLWNLTPWSWLSDWLLTTGSTLSNIADIFSFNLAMPYAYVMEHIKCTDVFTSTTVIKGGVGGPGPLIIHYDVKSRKKASPFGFGLAWEGFSPKQLAILAALGISRH